LRSPGSALVTCIRQQCWTNFGKGRQRVEIDGKCRRRGPWSKKMYCSWGVFSTILALRTATVTSELFGGHWSGCVAPIWLRHYVINWDSHMVTWQAGDSQRRHSTAGDCARGVSQHGPFRAQKRM
jgi:hypothetical protein